MLLLHSSQCVGRATFAYDAAAVEGTFGRNGALHGRTRIFHKGASIYDVRKMFGFLTPSPLVCIWI